MKFSNKINLLIVLMILFFPTESQSSGNPINLDSMPAVNVLGNLCYKNGKTKKISTDDVLWLARMIHGETNGKPSKESSAALLWSITQRTVLPRWRENSLSHLARAYSLSINENWTEKGSKCKGFYKKKYKGKGNSQCAPVFVKKRTMNMSMKWKDIHPIARKSVLNFAQGLTDNSVIGSIGWSAKKNWDRGRGKKAKNKKGKYSNELDAKFSNVVHQILSGQVFFYRGNDPDTRKWSGTEVFVTGPKKSCFLGKAINKLKLNKQNK